MYDPISLNIGWIINKEVGIILLCISVYRQNRPEAGKHASGCL